MPVTHESSFRSGFFLRYEVVFLTVFKWGKLALELWVKRRDAHVAKTEEEKHRETMYALEKMCESSI